MCLVDRKARLGKRCNPVYFSYPCSCNNNHTALYTLDNYHDKRYQILHGFVCIVINVVTIYKKLETALIIYIHCSPGIFCVLE